MAEQSAKGSALIRLTASTSYLLKPGKIFGTDAGLREMHKPLDCATIAARLLMAAEDEFERKKRRCCTQIHLVWSGINYEANERQ